MRVRLFIPAAIIVAIAYLNGRRRSAAVETFSGLPDAGPGAPEPPTDGVLRAEAEAADARELGLAEPEAEFEQGTAPETEAAEPWEVGIAGAEAAAGVAADAEHATEAGPGDGPAAKAADDSEPDHVVLSEWHAAAAGPAPEVQESGRFTVGGWASQPGDMALTGVSFRSRLDRPVPVERLRLVTTASSNMAAAGPMVLAEPGFAPDAEGFTILLAAGAPGPFAASGRFELLGA